MDTFCVYVYQLTRGWAVSNSVCRVERKEFINNKYIDHKFARCTISMASNGLEELCEAVRTRDLMSVIQLYAEGVELHQPLPDPGKVGWTTEPVHYFFYLDTESEEEVPPAGGMKQRSSTLI